MPISATIMGRIRIEKKHKKRESIQHIPIAYHNNKLILGKMETVDAG